MIEGLGCENLGDRGYAHLLGSTCEALLLGGRAISSVSLGMGSYLD